jgi:hypothetical protein
MFGGGGLRAFTFATATCCFLALAFFPFLNIWSAQYNLSDIGPGAEAIARSSMASGAFFMLALILGIVTRTIARTQSARDAEALRVRVDSATSAEADQPGFVLFLRPFTLDRGTGMSRLTVLIALAGVFVPSLDMLTCFAIFALVWNGFMNTDLADFERQIRTATAPFGPLVAIGQGEALRRAGLRFESNDENWKVLALNLLRNASLIVIVPAASAGTRWEVDTLFAEGFTNKTVFLFPPRSAFKERTEFDRLTRDWQTLSDGLSKAGYQASPVPGPDGSVVIYPDRGRPPLVFPLKGGNATSTFFQLGHTIKRALRKALAGLPSMPRYSWNRKIGQRARSVPDAIWRATGGVIGSVAAVAAVVMGIAAIGVGGVPVPLTGSMAAGRLLNADSIRAAESFETYQSEQQEAEFLLKAAETAFLSDTGATREQTRLLLFEFGKQSLTDVLRETPAAVEALVETLPESGNTFDVLDQKQRELTGALQPYVYAAPMADLKKLLEDQDTIVSILSDSENEQLCVDYIDGVFVMNSAENPELRENEIFMTTLKRREQRALIAGWRGRNEPVEHAPPTESDWVAVWEQVAAYGLPESVLQEVDKGANADFKSLSPSDRCAWAKAFPAAVLAQPDEIQARVVPASFPKPKP